MVELCYWWIQCIGGNENNRNKIVKSKACVDSMEIESAGPELELSHWWINSTVKYRQQSKNHGSKQTNKTEKNF